MSRDSQYLASGPSRLRELLDILSAREQAPLIAEIRIFEATHVHVRTGAHYMLTSINERMEVTGDEGYPLAEYEDAEGRKFAQRADRFMDGRFQELPL